MALDKFIQTFKLLSDNPKKYYQFKIFYKIKDLFIFFMNKTPLELKEISNDILRKFITKFNVDTMIS